MAEDVAQEALHADLLDHPGATISVVARDAEGREIVRNDTVLDPNS